jgi:hypothetical protein
VGGRHLHSAQRIEDNFSSYAILERCMMYDVRSLEAQHLKGAHKFWKDRRARHRVGLLELWYHDSKSSDFWERQILREVLKEENGKDAFFVPLTRA